MESRHNFRLVAKKNNASRKRVLKDLKQAIFEVNKIKSGRLKGIPAGDLINQL